MKYYLIAGEASGDMYGAALMKHIKENDTSAEFRFWGGDAMATEGGTLVRHYKNHDFMGIVEVVKHLPTILSNISFCKKDITDYRPDAVIYIDFPGFNLKIVKHVKTLGIKSFYYISPTVWAWKEGRVKPFKKYVDHLFCIFPFEQSFYKTRHNHHVEYVGHPLLDMIQQNLKPTTQIEFCEQNNLSSKKIIAILPGSRTSEIRENLRTMQEIIPQFPDFQFVIAGMSHFDEMFYKQYITHNNVSIVFGKTQQLLQIAEAAVVVCGTASLEAALIGCPEVIVFKTNPITFYFGKMIVKLNYLGLPNIIMDKEITPELLQNKMTSGNIATSLQKILFDTEYRNTILDNYKALRTTLGDGGASFKTAKFILEFMKA